MSLAPTKSSKIVALKLRRPSNACKCYHAALVVLLLIRPVSNLDMDSPHKKKSVTAEKRSRTEFHEETSHEETIKRQKVVTSAYDSIFEAYKDAEGIAVALKSAKEKLFELEGREEEKSEAHEDSRNKLDYQYRLIEEAIQDLVEIVDEGELPAPSISSDEFVRKMMNEMREFAERAIVPEMTIKEKAELQKEIDEMSKFVVMLEGAKAVADVGSGKTLRRNIFRTDSDDDDEDYDD